MTAKKDGFGHEKNNEGDTTDWITPKWIIDAFNNKVDEGMFFDLDPCASLSQPWPCARDSYTVEQNGLLQEWRGTVWCNPPYGSSIGVWARMMANHGDGVMLIFARLETSAWFDEIFTTADGFLFPKGRIAFCEFICECGYPRSWHISTKSKKVSVACGNFRNTNKAEAGDVSGAPSAFVAWGTKSRSALIELCDEGMKDDKGNWRSSAFLDKAFYTGSRQW